MQNFLRDNKGFNTNNKTTLYKSIGMGLFDMVLANKIYEKAIKNEIGKNMDL